MKTRIISGVIGVVLLVLVALCDVMLFNIAVAILTAMAVYEIYKVSGVNDKVYVISGVLLAFAYMLVSVFAETLTMPLVYIFVIVLFALFMTGKEQYTFEQLLKVFFATALPVFLFGHILKLRAAPNGQFIVWFVFVISFLTDIFAYFTGVFLGKHKLAPVLSPKKTIEGSVGGFLGAVIGTFVFCIVLEKCWAFTPNYLNGAIISVIGSIVSQFGDLAASSIKRHYGIKDYGNIMPGHGGVMDRFDGIIFTAPVVYYLLTILPII